MIGGSQSRRRLRHINVKKQNKKSVVIFPHDQWAWTSTDGLCRSYAYERHNPTIDMMVFQL